MHVTGNCHCGNITYKANVDPQKVSLCHCIDCQILTGCAYRVSAKIAVEDFEFLTGKPKIYVKIADSGAKRVQAFCENCGTPLYSEALENPKFKSLRVGTITQRAQLPPHQQIWCRSALPWTENISKVGPKYEKQEAPAIV